MVRLTYALSKSVLTCTTVIHNTDSRSIPIGDGWHPYFRTSGSIGKLLLSLPSHSVVEVTPPFKVPTGNVVDGSRRTTVFALNRKEMDSVFDFGEKQRRVTTKLIDPKLGIEVQLWQESGRRRYRYLVVYRPPTGSSVAIEPWTCAPKCVQQRDGTDCSQAGSEIQGFLQRHTPGAPIFKLSGQNRTCCARLTGPCEHS